MPFLIQNIFLIRQRGDQNALARHSKASKKNIFQTEIDFDVGSRLPPGAAIQNMNPFWVGLRFIDGCFRVYFGVGLRFFLWDRYTVCLKFVYGCIRVGLGLFRDRCVHVNSCK